MKNDPRSRPLPAALLAGAWVLAATWTRTAAAGEEPGAAFRHPGPFPVGVRTVVLVDGSRRDAFTGGSRTLLTEIWYPAADEARGRPTVRFSDYFGPYRQEASRVLKRDVIDIDREFRSLAVRDAPLRPGARPLLVFSHGNGGFRHQNAFQVEHLASHGYIVAAPDHTGNAGLTPLPEGSVGYDRKGRSGSARDRPLDVRFLIDRLAAAGDPGVEWLRGGIDGRSVGVLGHSFGGYTAVRLAEEDPRVKAILPMTVAFIGHPSRVPTLVMLGAEDRTVGVAGNVASRAYFLGCEGPRYLFVLKRGGHFTFTEMALIDPNWGDGIGRGKGSGDQVMDFIPTPLAKEIISAYTLAFFDFHLLHREEAGRFLEQNPWPEELEWWAGDRRIGAAPGPKVRRF